MDNNPPEIRKAADRLLPSAHAASKAELAREFIGRDDTFWGIQDDENDGASFRDSGYSAVQCTGYAHGILRKLGPGRVQVYGFDAADNPQSLIAQKIGGHDFALVDGRFIVDPWLVDVEGFDSQGVFDLHDAKDGARARELYGEAKAWEIGVG